MEDTVQQLLTDWNLEVLHERFAGNLITSIEQFKKLTESLIRELIPEIGIRINFLEKFEIFNAPLQFEEELINSGTLNESNGSIQDTLSNSTNQSDTTLYVHFNESALVGQDAVAGLTDQEIRETPASQYKQLCLDKTQLRYILEKTNKGKSLLNHYEINHKFNATARDLLTEIVVDHELETTVDKRITIDRFKELSHAIEALFPTEHAGIYFTVVRNTNNHKTGTGKLFRKYYNLRRRYREFGLINSAKKGKAQKISSTGSSLTDEIDSDDVNPEAEVWLRNSSEPWDKVVEYWDATHTLRKTVLEKCEKLGSYLLIYPVLKEQLGYTLLERDFPKLHPNAASIYIEWKSFSQNIIKYAEENYKKSKFIANLLAGIPNDNYDTPETSFRILQLLPGLIKPVPIKKGKSGSHWKPSRLEVQEGFIITPKTISDLQPIVEQKKRKLLAYDATLQPTPVVIEKEGGTFECYVYVDDHYYQVASPLKAIDICFQIIHVLHALYPIEAEQVWLLLQKGVYKFETVWDKQFTCVNTLISQLQR